MQEEVSPKIPGPSQNSRQSSEVYVAGEKDPWSTCIVTKSIVIGFTDVHGGRVAWW